MKVCVKGKLNQIAQLNDFLDDWNHEMQIGDRLECVATTSQQEFHAIRKRFPRFLGFALLGDVCPRMTRKIAIHLAISMISILLTIFFSDKENTSLLSGSGLLSIKKTIIFHWKHVNRYLPSL